jgi:hypothetical protein
LLIISSKSRGFILDDQMSISSCVKSRLISDKIQALLIALVSGHSFRIRRDLSASVAAAERGLTRVRIRKVSNLLNVQKVFYHLPLIRS